MTRAGFPALRMTLLAAVLAGLPVGTAHTADMPQVAVRVGNHPGFGRVVFDLPGQVEYELTQQGQHVIIEFKRDLTIGSAPGAPHNVQNITGGKGHAEFDVTPGTIVRTSRMGDRVVIDVADGSSGQASSGPPSLPASPVPSRASAKQASTQEALATPPATAATPAREAASTPAAVATPVKGAASTPAAAVPPTKGAASTSVVAATPAKRAASTKRPSDKPASPPAQAPAAAVPPALAAAPSLRTSPPAAVPAAPTSPAPVSPQHDSPPALAASTSAAVAAAQPSAAPAAATADDTAVVEDLQSSELIVPFAAPLGVAAFRRGNGAVVVFDQALTLDLSALHDDPVFSTAVVQTLPTRRWFSYGWRAAQHLPCHRHSMPGVSVRRRRSRTLGRFRPSRQTAVWYLRHPHPAKSWHLAIQRQARHCWWARCGGTARAHRWSAARSISCCCRPGWVSQWCLSRTR